MRTLKMTLMVSITFAAMITLAATEPTEQAFKLKYLSGITSGKVVHTLTVKAHDFNEAMTKSRHQCLNDLLDRKMAHDDIIDMCANPRL